MDWWLWPAAFLLLAVVLYADWENKRKAKQRRILNLIHGRKNKGGQSMAKTFERFIGKDCVITTMSSTITGKVESIEENWLLIHTDEGIGNAGDMVNVDYISRIREHPVNSKGKKKTIISIS